MPVPYKITSVRLSTCFGLVIVGLCTGLASSQLTQGRKPLPSSHLRYPNFGVAFDAPDGYLSAPPDDVGEIVRIAGETGPDRVLVVSTVPVGAQTLGNYVAELRANRGWKVASESDTSLDGESAIRVTGKASQEEAPVEAVFAKHERYIFSITRLGADTAETKRSLELVRSTWKWLPFEKPSRRLVIVDDTASLFNGRVTLPMPVVMRPFLGEDHPKFGIYDYQRGAFVMIVDVQAIAIPKELSLDQMKTRFADQLRVRMDLNDRVAWRDVKGATRSVVTQTLEGKSAGAVSAKSHFQMALSRLDPKTWLLFTLTLTGVDGEERQLFEQAFSTMLERFTIKGSEKPLTKK